MKYLSVDSSLCESWQGPKISSYCSQTQNGTRHSKSQLTRSQRLVWILAISSEIYFYVFSSTALCPSPTPPQSCHQVLAQCTKTPVHQVCAWGTLVHQHPVQSTNTCPQVQSTVLKQLQFCPSGISKHERLSSLAQFMSWFTHVRFIGWNLKMHLTKKGLLLLLHSDWHPDHSSFKKVELKH